MEERRVENNISHDKINGSVACGIMLIANGLLGLLPLIFVAIILGGIQSFQPSYLINAVGLITTIAAGILIISDAVKLKYLRLFFSIMSIVNIVLFIIFFSNAFSDIQSMLSTIRFILFITLAVGFIIMTYKKDKDKYRYLLILSSIIVLVSVIFSCVYLYNGFELINSIDTGYLFIAATILAGINGIVYSVAILLMIKLLIKGYTEKPINKNEINDIKSGLPSTGKLILLAILTFGIYALIWVYRSSRYLNLACNEENTAKKQLLLYMFVPFYFIYWLYKSADKLDELTGNNKSTLVLILAIFIGIVAVIIVNEMLLEHSSGKKRLSSATTSNADEIRKYRKLYEDNAITEEEYLRKKEELLS